MGTDIKGFQAEAVDAFHDVSDEHPFHLPKIWNSCKKADSCVLNVTTLTMNVNGTGGTPFQKGSPPLSALELRAKIKSRVAAWEAAGLGNQPGSVDKNNTICREINEHALSWALANADELTRARYEKDGIKLVIVDDQQAPIGLTGPTW